MLHITANPDCSEEHNKLKGEREREQTCPINEKPRGGGETGRMEKDREESCYRMGGVEQVERGRENKIKTQEKQSQMFPFLFL